MKHRYQINRYCKLVNKKRHINGCWKLDFDKIVLTNFKYKSLIWIWWCTSWITRWQPAQFGRIQNMLKRIRVNVLGWNLGNIFGVHSDNSWHLHQQNIIPSVRNGSVRVDVIRQRWQEHLGGGFLRARRQYHASRCISLSNHNFTVSSHSVGVLF